MKKAADRKQMIQQGFDTVAAGYDHPALSFSPETARRSVVHLPAYKVLAITND
jgi:hypothetical protein